MESLQVGQVVALELDGGEGPLNCVVTALAGETATLVHTGVFRDELCARLKAGSSGFLVVGDSNSVLGLRGAAIMTPENNPLIDFVVTDGCRERGRSLVGRDPPATVRARSGTRP